MNLGVVGTALLLLIGVAGVSGSAAEDERPPIQCEEGERFFMEEVEQPDIDYSMRSVSAADDRHHFIQSPPLAHLSERICDLGGWLEEFVPEGPMRWFDYEPQPRLD